MSDFIVLDPCRGSAVGGGQGQPVGLSVLAVWPLSPGPRLHPRQYVFLLCSYFRTVILLDMNPSNHFIFFANLLVFVFSLLIKNEFLLNFIWPLNFILN